MKRMTNRTAYEVTTARAKYLVTMEHLKNDTYGNPRYEFTVTPVEFLNGEKFYNEYRFTAVYRAKGHYCGDYEECKWIVEQYEKELV